MSEVDQFWQYAKEAIVSVGYAKTNEDKQDLLELARTWTRAALQQRAHPLVDHDSPAQAGARKGLTVGVLLIVAVAFVF